MKNHGSRLLLILVILSLTGYQWMNRGIRLGLDLAGGAALSYRIEEDPSRESTEKVDINTVIKVIEKRINALGLAEISLTATDDNEILIEIPGRSKEQLDRIKSIIEESGELEFRIVETEEKTAIERDQRRDMGTFYEVSDPRYRWVPSADPGRDDFLVLIEEAPLQAEVDALKARAAEDEDVADELHTKEQALQDIMTLETFTGKDLAAARVQRQNVQIVVFFQMKLERRGDFGDFTTRHIKRQMAIVLNGKVESAPVINSTLPGEGIIEGGRGSGFDPTEATALTITLESGATGVNLVLEREDQLGPSLGADAIQRGQISILAGFICVLLIMVWLYRMPGIIANIALLMNVVILMGTLAFFSAALTLAGIAGIVLTLGMAVDANILIFERLREERSRGKSLVEALAAGYDRAIVAIVDANVTTVLTAIVLIVLGSGTVKGFGVTLTVGILASMFTAIYVTRTIFEWGISSGVMTRLGFGKDRKLPTFDFMNARKWFTGPSIVLMAIGFAIFIARDEAESKDLEFVGGQQTIVQLTEAITRAELKELVGDSAYPSLSVVRLDSRGVTATDPEASNRWQIRHPLNDRPEGDAFVKHVEETLGDRLLPHGFDGFTEVPATEGFTTATITFRTLASPEGLSAEKLTTTLGEFSEKDAPAPLQSVTVIDGDDDGTYVVTATVAASEEAELLFRDTVRLALQRMDTPVFLSDPMPSVSFLNPGRAEELWRTALRAVLVAMLLQIVYIRLRFADFKHGFAAACALIHDVTIALGFVAVFDASGLVHAKINLVLIAAFLTLIGYSMNDTIVVFDRIRENLGKKKVVRTKLVNAAINQTLARSIRTSITTWIVVMIQFVLNRGTGSVLEGFAFVMVIGVVSGTYSSIFIAGPLLLFLPDYWRKLSANRRVLWVQLIASAVGAIMGITAKGHGAQMYIGVALAANIPIHFFAHFIPWLRLDDPDSLLEDEIAVEEKQRPLHKPGI